MHLRGESEEFRICIIRLCAVQVSLSVQLRIRKSSTRSFFCGGCQRGEGDRGSPVIGSITVPIGPTQIGSPVFGFVGRLPEPPSVPGGNGIRRASVPWGRPVFGSIPWGVSSKRRDGWTSLALFLAGSTVGSLTAMAKVNFGSFLFPVSVIALFSTSTTSCKVKPFNFPMVSWQRSRAWAFNLPLMVVVSGFLRVLCSRQVLPV